MTQSLSYSPSLESIKQNNPKLFKALIEHPNEAVLDCYCQLERMQFNTLYYIFTTLLEAGYSKETISEATKLYATLG